MKKEDLQALLKKYAEDKCNSTERALLEMWYLVEDHDFSKELSESDINQDLNEVLNLLPKQEMAKLVVPPNIAAPFIAACADEKEQKRFVRRQATQENL